ncbi:minor capsid protein [Streptomyces sp. NPDC006477]|uniref:minor capsid protein n=1 Tax=Streptomyces sp. NPDC006477 TaxID=3364747 RepID=UPI003688FA09
MVTEVAAALEEQFDWLIRPSSATGNEEGNLFEDALPDTPDFAVGLYEYGGSAPSQTLGNRNPTERPRLQVLVRHLETEDAKAFAKQIMRYLITINDQVLSGVRYVKISAASNVSIIGTDSENRHRYSANYEVEKEWSPE